MVASNDILEIKLFSTYANPGNQGMNVFQYEVILDTPEPLSVVGQDIADQWMTNMADALQDVTSNLIDWTRISMVNLSDPLEVWDGVPDTLRQGVVSGDCLPPYAAWGFALHRTNASTRNGSKRFWGVPESLQLNGEVAGSAIAAMPLIAGFLAAEQVIILSAPVPNEVHLGPVIVRKDAHGLLLASQPVLSGNFRWVTTQSSRKFGRGM